jgi:hypothetical protein
MGVQRGLRGPMLNQYKLVFIVGIGKQFVLQAACFCQYQRLKFLIGL